MPEYGQIRLNNVKHKHLRKMEHTYCWAVDEPGRENFPFNICMDWKPKVCEILKHDRQFSTAIGFGGPSVSSLRRFGKNLS